jgi:hypothetical protein
MVTLFVGQDCVGPNLPSSRVTYPESSVLCANNAIPGVVRNAVSLGVACETENATTFFYNDYLFFECGATSDDFENVVDSSDTTRYACGSLATFATSTVPTEQVLSNVSISTDDLWLSKQFMQCFTFSGIAAPSVPAVSMAPTTPAPIQAPITSTAPITESPSQVPIASDVGKMRNPTLNSTASNGIPVSAADKNDTGLWIGLFIGGLTTGIVIVAGIVFLQRRKTRAGNLPVEDSLVHSSLSGASCPGSLPPTVPQRKEVSTRNPRTVHNVGSQVAVIENASLAVVMEVSDIPGNQADPSGIYEGWEA